MFNKDSIMLKIGIVKETKIPTDNRVALTPKDIIDLQGKYPQVKFYVQKSDIRAYADCEYEKHGIPVVDSLNDCDILFGVKEVKLDSLIPNKHYFFFGHIAKEQSYNRPLIQKMIESNITFTDYEYLVDDDNQRLCAFGWWAGVIGAYNTIRAYGLRTSKFELEKPNLDFTLEKLISNLKEVSHLCNTSIIITGNGRVSKGAQYTMQEIGAKELTPDSFLNREQSAELVYTVLTVKDLVKHKDGLDFNNDDFKQNGQDYVSVFSKYAYSSEILLSCHFWDPSQPVYLDEELLKDKNLSIKIVGDVTCDIKGSILSTIRSSTHDEPFYDFNPTNMSEEPAFSNMNNITVMAVDTCPNALALDTSSYFSQKLSEHVLPLLINRELNHPILERATILSNGELTKKYSYLKRYAGLL